MTGHGAKFGRKQEQAIAALLTQPSMEAAARSIGIAVKTLRTWLKVPEFHRSYLDARREVVSQATRASSKTLGSRPRRC